MLCWIGEAPWKLWWNGDEQPGLDANGILNTRYNEILNTEAVIWKASPQDHWSNPKAAGIIQQSQYGIGMEMKFW